MAGNLMDELWETAKFIRFFIAKKVFKLLEIDFTKSEILKFFCFNCKSKETTDIYNFEST